MFDTASLFGVQDIGFDGEFSRLRRADLGDGAWVDYAPLWLEGDEALFDHLSDAAQWSQPVTRMWDRDVATPRLIASIDSPTHPIIPELVEALSGRYGVRLDRVSAGWYRDGRDSVAYHGDRVARERPEAIVATVSLRGPRRFLIRPKAGGSSLSYSLGHGDLIVMGGSCQRTFEHAVPKVKSAPPRIALMFRHSYE
ncbi:MAG: alpha-ketoglutarate-dependent dioxygenase AlkB [Acidimicrobiia bacterium]|nr:alpha-ketoglutarate-dependent dioxygenase AlkB [Acidimicrobiia bacterium]NNF10613.1 alpha-ketoglutarate-dependent dioxygenase AlkB [Acidimicrobiia bacterium]NNL69769.1 alpha-ketoglutarate-dependent dioxygenase AlkB [Acidimicrobiia bacterium]